MIVCSCVLLYTVLFFAAVLLFGLFTGILLFKQVVRKRKNKRLADASHLCVGIFHPYCNAGGGGERVLWCAIRALQNRYADMIIYVYTGDNEATPKQILSKCRNNFNIELDPKRLEFVFLNRRSWIQAERYPCFTLLGQSLGSIILGFEAIFKFQPDVYIDTMGYAFTFPIFKYIGGCKVGCYVHYPTISTDMLRRVSSRAYAHNNQNYVANNPFITLIKLTYYRIFSRMYSMVGCCAETIMVNSSWTENHIISLWNATYKTHRVYPPCEVSNLKNLEHLPSSDDTIYLLSVGQFRPEKDHPMQLQAMYELRTLLVNNDDLWSRLKLIFVGSCRNQEDQDRVKNMIDLSKHLSLENSVEFKVNASYQELIQCYQKSLIGIHAMWNEHFGISVVECMAAGLIMVAHRSGGPMMDIVETAEGSQTGYLAGDADEYAHCIATILYNSLDQNETIRNAARASVDRFSEKEFENQFLRATNLLFE